jgi:hypothetical protein
MSKFIEELISKMKEDYWVFNHGPVKAAQNFIRLNHLIKSREPINWVTMCSFASFAKQRGPKPPNN